MGPWHDKHVRAIKGIKGLKPSVELAWDPNKDLPQESSQRIIAEQPRDEYVMDWNSSDVVGCRGGLRACADTVHFSIRQVLAEIIKDGLERTLVAQVALAKVPKEADLLSFPLSVFQIHRSLVFNSKDHEDLPCSTRLDLLLYPLRII